MTTNTGLRTTVLVIAAILVATVITVAACAPASPSSQAQNGSPTKAPTSPPTNTPETIIIYQDSTPVAIQMPPVPLTPYVLKGSLRRESDEYEATKEATANAGRSADTMEDPFRMIFITVDSLERSNKVADFLESRSVTISSKNENPSYAEFVVVAYVPRSLLKELSYMEGITRIEAPAGPANESPEPSSQMGGPILNLNTISGIATWYGVGVKGAGVQVGIIDGGFQDIRTRVPAAFARPTVTSLCFQRGVDEPTEGDDDDPFQHCETFTDHGTSVAEKLVEVAPRVTIYISNPHDEKQLRQAVNWMTAKALDNNPGHLPEPAYTATSNDEFDIKVINMSRSFPWDGPGDGTSPLQSTNNYSPIRSANDAIANGALWINAAGNAGQNSWFSRNTRLHEENNQLSVDFDNTADTDTCNDMTLKKGQKYWFQARWKDQWGRATKDLDLHLMGPRRDGGQLELLEESENAQNGGLTDYPRELIENFTAKADGIHCLMLTAGDRTDKPEWIQLQVFDGDATQGFQFKHPELLSSINNPAESNNPGLMAIGNSSAIIHIALSPESSRGPVPEPTPGNPNRPDVAGANAILGTSFSAPRVAGMAALVIDALGDDANYSEPHQIAKYLRNNAAQYTPGEDGFISTHPDDPSTLTNQDPNAHWGHGLAFLPQPEKPKNVTIALVPGTKDQISVSFRNEPWDADLDFSLQRALANVIATGGTGAALYETSKFIGSADDSITIQVRRGANYQATVLRCLLVFPSTCTERSDPSNELYLPSTPQTPTSILAIPGHEGATIKWHNPGDAGHFEIEELN